MSKKKTIASSKSKPEQAVNLEYIFEPGKMQRYIIFALIAVLSIGLSVYYITFALSKNGSYGFPLDDPWIHLTFAKNLVDYHSFSYFKNEMATAGSTSPVYTIILAIGFLITKNEMALSYVLGILFLALSGISFYKLSSYDFGRENILALLITGAFLADKWLNFVADSGMETTMFIFILLGCAYFYKKRKAIHFAVFLGLIFWARPDGIAFIATLAADYLWIIYLNKTRSRGTRLRVNKTEMKKYELFTKNEWIKIGAVAGGLLVVYFLMNLMLSGSLLPNTYNAKLTYYTPEFRSRADFLRAEVWEYFTSGAYGLVMVGFIFAVLLFLYDVFRKKYNNNTLYITFIFILVFIYWYMLPYAHRFGRYMMPVIPFLLLVSATGFRDFAKLLGGYFKSRNIAVGLSIFALGAVILFSIKDYNNNKENYAENCKYISDRQVAAAYWLRDNTKETDIIATHDVGAIAFYSGRKIVDVAGLVTPELITKLNDANYSIYMAEYMKNSGVTYLAFLRQWYRVANQNPVFTTADSLPPEEMDVYKFIPEEVHILPKDVNSMILYSFEMLQQKQTQKALQVLNQALSRDPKSSVTYYWIAYTYMMMNDKANFEKNILNALKIFPEYKEALIQAGFFYKNERKFTDSKSNLEKYISLYPNDKKAAEMLSEVKDSINANKK